MTMTNDPNLNSGARQTATPTVQNPSAVPGSRATDNARYTPQQEREMGVSDGGSVKVQPSGAFVMIALTYVFIAAAALVIAAIIWHFTGGGGPSAVQ